jgi:hypothetical protein
MVMLKECKTKECQNKFQHLQRKEKGGEEDDIKGEEIRLKRT